MRVGPARMDAAVADPQDRPTQGGCASGQRTRFFTLTRPVWTGIDVLVPQTQRLTDPSGLSCLGISADHPITLAHGDGIGHAGLDPLGSGRLCGGGPEECRHVGRK